MTIRCTFSLRVKEAIIARYNGICPLCDKPLVGRIEFDHILPLALGGLDEPSNLQPVHTDGCHKTKTADDVKRIRKADRMGGKRGSQYRRRKLHGPQLKSRKTSWPSRPFEKRVKEK